MLRKNYSEVFMYLKNSKAQPIINRTYMQPHFSEMLLAFCIYLTICFIYSDQRMLGINGKCLF